VRTGPDRALLAASIVFAGVAALGSAAAIRDQLPGDPLGIGIPLSVPAGLLAGWGAGVAVRPLASGRTVDPAAGTGEPRSQTVAG
jgi:hypothetical protein